MKNKNKLSGTFCVECNYSNAWQSFKTDFALVCGFYGFFRKRNGWGRGYSLLRAVSHHIETRHLSKSK